MTDDAPLVGIGSAILDVLVRVEDDFLAQQKIEKGTVRLVGEDEIRTLVDSIRAEAQSSGGQAANTMSAAARLGTKAAFIGKLRNDAAGKTFLHDMTAQGVAFAGVHTKAGPATGCCVVLITPDAERTMITYLGAAATLTDADLSHKYLAAARLVYMESYLWDLPGGRGILDAVAKVPALAVLNLSDPACVARHRALLRKAIPERISVLVANEDEICALHETDDFGAALGATRGLCDTVVLTRGAEGAVILAGDATHEIAAEPVSRVVDTTGAGDAFAAGFLHGLLADGGLKAAGRLGAETAARVLGHIGARIPG